MRAQLRRTTDRNARTPDGVFFRMKIGQYDERSDH
jgi:hypothetical protein